MTQPTVSPGIEVLLNDSIHLLRHARVGLVVGPASVDRSLNNVIDLLHRIDDVNITALYGAEHGVRGDAQAGQHVGDETDATTGVPVYSLYGSQKRPTAAMLEAVDILVVDLADVGCRYWTFLYTMAYVLEAAAEFGKKVVVLDRPNPIGGNTVEGNVLHENFSSFVGLYPITTRTGLTFGEAARLFNSEFGINADLTVVPVHGWQRSMWFTDTGLPFVPPSPNTPTLDTLTLYPGTCLVEGTNLSEGRGTTRPFEMIGAPNVNAKRLADALNERGLPGVRFRPTYFVPTFSKHNGEKCHGIQVHITDPQQVRAVSVGLHVLHAFKLEAADVFSWRPPYRQGGRHFIDLLAGSDELRIALDDGDDPDTILQRWEPQRQKFATMRQQYLLY